MLTVHYNPYNGLAPTYASPGAAGADLYSTIEFSIMPGGTAFVPTGLQLEIPEGYVGLICPRSGLALKGVTVANAPGVIDPDFRGEVAVLLYNRNRSVYTVREGDRIAQLLLVPCLRAEFVDAPLSETTRGRGGFGSTGQ